MVKKRSQQRQHSGHDARMRQAMPATLSDKPILYFGDTEYVGVSEVFREFAEPMIKGSENLAEIQAGLTFAMLGWNLALAPQHRRPQLLASALQTLSVDMRLQARTYLATLLERKSQHFSEYHWLVEHFHFEEQGNKTRLVVAVLNLPAVVETAAVEQTKPTSDTM